MQIPATSMDEYDEPLRLVGLTTAGGRKCQSDIAMSRPCDKKAALEKGRPYIIFKETSKS